MNNRTFLETRPTRRRQITVFYVSRRRNFMYNKLADERESDDDYLVNP